MDKFLELITDFKTGNYTKEQLREKHDLPNVQAVYTMLQKARQKKLIPRVHKKRKATRKKTTPVVPEANVKQVSTTPEVKPSQHKTDVIGDYRRIIFSDGLTLSVKKDSPIRIIINGKDDINIIR
jgi:hypothetical protein